MKKKDAVAANYGISCNIKQLDYKSRSFTLIDCPGKYVFNETRNASIANVQIIVVSATDWNTELYVQTLLVHRVHSPQIIILVNKMDQTNPPYDEKSYLNILENINKYFTAAFYSKTEQKWVIPVSGKTGENLTTKSTQMDWWKGTNKGDHTYYTVMSLLQKMNIPVFRRDAETRVIVYKQFPAKKTVCSYLTSGQLRENDQLVLPFVNKKNDKKTTQIQSIEINHHPYKQAFAGDYNVGLSLTNYELITRGTLLMTPHDPINHHIQKDIIAEIYHARKTEIKLSAVAVVAIQAMTIEMRISALLNSQPFNSNKIQNINPKVISHREKAQIQLTSNQNFILDISMNCKWLSRFTAFMGGKVAFIGRIIDIKLENGSMLSKHHKWQRIRLLFIGSKDPNCKFRLPKEIVSPIAMYLWRSPIT